MGGLITRVFERDIGVVGHQSQQKAAPLPLVIHERRLVRVEGHLLRLRVWLQYARPVGTRVVPN